MLHELGGDRLDRWMRAVQADDLPALHTLVTSLRRVHAAVTAGLSLPYSSGAVEGQVNRIKALKRAMYAAPASTCYANASSSRTESNIWPS
jgi:transposase